MTLIPVLLDSRPAFLGSDPRSCSLLGLPTGNGPLIRELVARVSGVTAHPPIVITNFTTGPEYERELRVACPRIDSITTPLALRERISSFDPADSLLVVAANIQPLEPLDLRLILGETTETQMVRHLLAFEATSIRTKEFVHRGDDGRVRRIQRYFDPVTWPFPAGVIASLIPIACLHTDVELPLGSLVDLRLGCAGRGFPSRDIRYYGPCFDLSEEEGALAMAERNVMAKDRSPESKTSALRLFGSVSASARIFGPVSIGMEVTLEEGAMIIGPAVLGDRCRVRSNAVVAQCIVLPDADVADGVTLRQRVVIDRPARNSGQTRDPQRRNAHWAPPQRAPASAPLSYGLSYQFMKRVIDAAVAFVALLFLAPLMGLIAILVKLDSRGPAFFGHLREGRDGTAFRCWKFRTMAQNADAMQRVLAAQQKMDGPQFKMQNDPRVTAVGKWLRNLNVDEFPQLLNVLLGEMSLVGPRPSPFRENQICVPWRNGRLSVRPGITGLWQICRRDRDQGDFHQWIHYDLLYVRNANLWVDLKIIVSTVFTLGGKSPVALSRIIRAHREPVLQPTWSELPTWTEAPAWTEAPLWCAPVEAVPVLADVRLNPLTARYEEDPLYPWDPSRRFASPGNSILSEPETLALGLG